MDAWMEGRTDGLMSGLTSARWGEQAWLPAKPALVFSARATNNQQPSTTKRIESAHFGISGARPSFASIPAQA